MERSASADVSRLLEQLYDMIERPDLNRCRDGFRELTDEISTLCMVQASPGESIPWAAFKLSPTEAEIMNYLFARQGKMVRSDTLIALMYGMEQGTTEDPENILKVFISRLRKKLDGSQYHIVTEWGDGFRAEIDRWHGVLSAGAKGKLILAHLERNLGRFVPSGELRAVAGFSRQSLAKTMQRLKRRSVARRGFRIVSERVRGYKLEAAA